MKEGGVTDPLIGLDHKDGAKERILESKEKQRLSGLTETPKRKMEPRENSETVFMAGSRVRGVREGWLAEGEEKRWLDT